MTDIAETTIAAIANAGFDVYMRNPKDTYLLFTDGTRIGYLQQERFGGLSLSSVHIPNTTSGTGYRIADGLDDKDLTAETLERAFVNAPEWADSHSRKSVRKWKDFDAYRGANGFNGGYQLIASRK